MDYSVSGIKAESIQAVMDILSSESYITRSELAARCQLSLTTIGKIVNGLHEYGVLSIAHPKTAEKGRTPATVGFSDTATLAMLRIGEHDMVLDLIDFRLRPIHRICRRITPDRDPSEALMAFLTECRRDLAPIRKQIRLCGIIAERKDISPSLLEKEISAQLELTVTFRDHAADAMARAAAEQGIATENSCVALLTDHGDGIILYHGEICKGGFPSAFSNSCAPSDHIDRMINTFLTLTAILSPDVLLVCTEHSPEVLREHLESSLRAASLPHPVAVEVRSIHDFIALGAGIAMRRAWLDEVINDIRRLRAPYADPHTLTSI